MKKFQVKILIVVSLLLVLIPTPSKADGDHDDEASSSAQHDGGSEVEDDPPKSCYKYTWDFHVSTMLNALTCLGSKFKPRSIVEYATRSWCILKCLLQQMGTINAEGYFDDVNSAFVFEETFPPEVQEALLPSVQACFSLSELFNPKDYFCKTYEPFISCLVKGLLPALLPYQLMCFVNPAIGILLDTLKNIAPNDPTTVMSKEFEELRRIQKIFLKHQQERRRYKCFNKDCSRKYEIKKYGNGTQAIFLYDRNMTELSRMFRKSVDKIGNEL